jgi:hypothetical protein
MNFPSMRVGESNSSAVFPYFSVSEHQDTVMPEFFGTVAVEQTIRGTSSLHTFN